MNTKQLSLSAFVGALSLVMLAPVAYGAEGDRDGKHGKGERRGQHIQLSEEVREDLKDAFKDGDYEEYVAIAKENDMKRVMTEEQFEKKIERYEQKSEMKEYVLDGDYAAWRAVIGDDKAIQVTSDNFYLLTDLAKAHQSEDEEGIEDAREALRDAGIKKPMKKGHGKRGGKGSKGEKGLDKELRGQNVSELSDDDKQDLLKRIIEQIKARLGLA